MRPHPSTLSAVCLVLCCSVPITFPTPAPAADVASKQSVATQTRTDSKPRQNAVTEVDLSAVFAHLHNEAIDRARTEFSRLRAENPDWFPPAVVEQLISDYHKRSPADNRYLVMMAELATTRESARADLDAQQLKQAGEEIRQRKDAYHAMMLGWIYFQREEYATADKLFAQAGEWGEALQSKEARSLVALRLAHHAVKTGDYAAALRHAEKAAALGSQDSYISTGWLLFKKEAYDDAFTAFSQAPASAAKEQALAETCFHQSRRALAAGDDKRAEQSARCSLQHGHSEVMTTLGWDLYKSGQYAKAGHFFSAQNPPSEQAFYGHVLSLKADDQNKQAQELACKNSQRSQRIKNLCVDLVGAQMLADYQAKRYTAVLRQGDELKQFGETGNDLQALIAWSELSLGQYEDAANRFDTLLSQQPGETSHAHGLISSLTNSDNPKALANARKHHPLVDTLLAQQTFNAEITPPQNPTLGTKTKPAENSPKGSGGTDRLSKAIDLYHAGDYKSAYTILLELRPGFIEKQDSGLLILTGWAAFHLGRYTEARDDFLIAAKWTDDPANWLMVVEAEIALENLQRAKEIVDGLPPSDERNKMLSRLKIQQAVTAYRNKNYAQSESLLSSPELALNDENLELLGWSRYHQEKYQAAATAFEASYRSKPTLARAKGLVFSYIHLHQPARLVTLADELQGPLVGLTTDEAVREKLREGKEDWIGVSSDGVLIVQEPPKKTSAITRALQKLEGIPGFTWGSVDYDLVEDHTKVSFVINQGIDWVVLPGDITVNTFIEYRSINNALRTFYDEDEFGYGLEFQRAPFNFGIEHLPKDWIENEQTDDITNVYLGWYHSWYKYLRRRHSKTSNPFDVNAYTGSTYGRISHDIEERQLTTVRGFVRQGMDWFTSLTPIGELTLNTYAAYRFRFRNKDNYWYDAHGPAVGAELQRSPLSLGMEYLWQINPRRHTTESAYWLYMTWYFDWNLKPD